MSENGNESADPKYLGASDEDLTVAASTEEAKRIFADKEAAGAGDYELSENSIESHSTAANAGLDPSIPEWSEDFLQRVKDALRDKATSTRTVESYSYENRAIALESLNVQLDDLLKIRSSKKAESNQPQ